MTALTTMSFNDIARDIHKRNVDAGWWTDLTTGESMLATRDRARLMMLITSEVSEADHGAENDINDDKLPHLPMFDVELADVAIRLFDMIGAEIANYGDDVEFDFGARVDAAASRIRARHDKLGWFKEEALDDGTYEFVSVPVAENFPLLGIAIVNEVSAAMEHLRKNRTAQYRTASWEAQATTFAVARLTGVDLLAVIQEKLDFNAVRPDHKLENRKAEDGKKF